MFGFLGSNGAGKTTTMRIALGVLRADAGRDPWRGADHREPAPPDVGLPARGARPVPEDDRARPARLLRRPAGRARGRRRPARPASWLARFRVPDFADRRAEELSKGNQQKVQFLAAILHDPEVLLMDEPFTGLDPVNIVLLREAILELRDRGKTIILSTHQMETVEAMCESVAIVDRGRTVVAGHAAATSSARPAGGWCSCPSRGDHRLEWLADVPGARLLRPGHRALGDRARPGRRAGCGPRGGARGGLARHPLRGRRPVARAGLHRARRPSRRHRADTEASAGTPRPAGTLGRGPPGRVGHARPSRERARAGAQAGRMPSREPPGRQQLARREARVRRARPEPPVLRLDGAAGRRSPSRSP